MNIARNEIGQSHQIPYIKIAVLEDICRWKIRSDVTGQFIGSNPYTQFLLYSPGDHTLSEYQVIEPTPGNYALVLSNTFPIGNYIQQLFVLPGTNGNKLLVFDTNGVTAVVYAFNGQTAP